MTTPFNLIIVAEMDAPMFRTKIGIPNHKFGRIAPSSVYPDMHSASRLESGPDQFRN